MRNVFKPNDPKLQKQWHLINTGQVGKVGNDANVLPAWQSVTGKGVVIGVVDDGLLTTHPDLKNRYRPDLSFDFLNNDPDPTPETYLEDRGITEALLTEMPELLQMLRQGASPEQLIQPLLNEIDQTLENFDLPEKLTTILEEMLTALEGAHAPDQITTLERLQQQLQALPPPKLLYESHGTSVAGVAAATGNNGIGATGVAPEASLAGIKLITEQELPGLSVEKSDPKKIAELEDQLEAKALSYKNQEIDIYNNSWGPPDNTLEGPGPKALAALQEGVLKGRGGLGNIFVWGAGNGLQNNGNDNVNYDGYANSRYTIAVGAIGADGIQSDYSEPGAAILVTSYSDFQRPGKNNVGITTTHAGGVGDTPNSSGQYTNDFGGTSSAAPLVSGVVALMLDANPNLTWRDVQHVLAKTAVQNDAKDSGWTLNGAGYHVNHKYGFGAVDATAAVSAAKTWKTVAPEMSATSGEFKINSFVPDNRALGLTSLIHMEQNLALESVEVVFDAKHEYRGDLEVILTSPDGTQSILAEQHKDDGNDYPRWTFSSVRHWGESSLGDWTLRVADKTGQGIEGLWNSWKLNVYGAKYDKLPNLKALVGDDNRNVLQGSKRDELIQGMAGNDRLFGYAGNDQMYGAIGHDYLRGGQGRDQLYGDEGRDRLFGGAQFDRLYGGGGSDRLHGGAGNDALVGGVGQDWLTGGKGSDRFVYESVKEGGDWITDFKAAEDLIDLHKIWRGVASEFTQGVSLSLSDIFDQFVNLTSVGARAVKVGVNLGGEGDSSNLTVSNLATLKGVSINELSVSNFIF